MLSTVRRLVAGSLRYKLLVMVVLPLLLLAPAMLGFAVYWSRQFLYEQLVRQVSTDLAVAGDAFGRMQRDYANLLESLAKSYAFQSALAAGDHAKLQDLVTAFRNTTGFDFLHFTDLKGRRILEQGIFSNGTHRISPLLQKAAFSGLPAMGVEVYPARDLREESGDLADRARTPLVPTPHAAPSGRRVDERGLVVHVVYPVRDLQGSVVALLDGGVLLNRNFKLVDAIRDLVYAPGTLPEGAVGAVSVFLGDVRVSTNVPLRPGERALGTRASREVASSVLEHGNTWTDRAFVVNDWYISGYEPIVDVYGRRVGMLDTGYLEAPFRSAYHRTLALLALMVLAAGALSALLAIRGARSIFRPIEAIARVVRATQAGHRRRIGPLASHDEIGELARQFDSMLDLLELRSQQLRDAAEKLESKVDERTAELSRKNLRLHETIHLLRETERQLAAAEKLAALGELTAGVAHEINNPIAVIQGNMEILRDELGEGGAAVRTEMDLVFEQVGRIRAIVEKLLRYARPSDYAGKLVEVRVGELLDDTLVLVRHELDARTVTVEKSYTESGPVLIDRQELQQVLVNLLINAAQALQRGGRITLLTRDWKDRGVMVEISDTGVGIARAHHKRVFDPFFTTKRRGGTGLGLSVSYALIRRYGGDITFSSREGRGSTFRVFLRGRPEPGAEAAETSGRDLDLSA